MPGDIVHWLRIDGVVEELYDVVALPGVVRPMALGFKIDEIRRTISVGDEAALNVNRRGHCPLTSLSAPARPENPLVKEALAACRGGLAAVVVFSLGINVLMLTAPLYMLKIFDRVISARSTEKLLYLTLAASVALWGRQTGRPKRGPPRGS